MKRYLALALIALVLALEFASALWRIPLGAMTSVTF